MNIETRNAKNYYTIDETKELIFGNIVSKSSMLIMVKKGEIPTIKVQTRRFVPSWYIEKMLALAKNEPSVNEA